MNQTPTIPFYLHNVGLMNQTPTNNLYFPAFVPTFVLYPVRLALFNLRACPKVKGLNVIASVAWRSN